MARIIGGHVKRMLSDDFEEELLGGSLCALHERILNDNTLMLAVRNDYLNVYYRGGSLLKLSKKPKNGYEASFDPNYAKGSPFSVPDSPKRIRSRNDMQSWVDSFPQRKQIMDYWFTKHPKMEREFQQLVVRENNHSPISKDTEYFISDIELAESDLAARFDLLGFQWPIDNRQSGNVRLALMEMKYGDGALAGKAGIVEHLKQFHQLLLDKKNWNHSMIWLKNKSINSTGLVCFNTKQSMRLNSL